MIELKRKRHASYPVDAPNVTAENFEVLKQFSGYQALGNLTLKELKFTEAQVIGVLKYLDVGTSATPRVSRKRHLIRWGKLGFWYSQRLFDYADSQSIRVDRASEAA